MNAARLRLLPRILQHFPEITHVHLASQDSLESLPKRVLESLRELPCLERLGIFTNETLDWPHAALATVGRMEQLKRLSLKGRFADTSFGQLTGLVNLQSISLGGTLPRNLFQTLAKLPQLETVSITGDRSFGQGEIPSDAVKAIQSFQGRPLKMRMYRGHYHASMIRAILAVDSLNEFILWGELEGATPDDFASLASRGSLKKLEINLSDPKLQQAVDRMVGARVRKLRADTVRDARRKRLGTRFGATHVNDKLKKHHAQPLVDGWLETMSKDGRKFDPAPILVYGDAGLQAMLERIFPEIVPTEKPQSEGSMTKAEARLLIGQLRNGNFSLRIAAQRKLIAEGRLHAKMIEAAIKDVDADAELRARCKDILDAWKPQESRFLIPKGREFQTAWNRYLSRITEFSSDQLLAETVVAALEARLDETDRAKLLAACFLPVAKCRDDSIYEIFVPLCEHEDVDVPKFVLHNLGGRAGNDYVTPMHRAAIESNRTELVKAGFENLPSPVWDRDYKPILRERLIAIFSQPPEKRPFRDDPSFLRRLAFSAWRNHQLPAGQTYLLDLTKASDPMVVLRALELLSDTDFLKQPLDKRLLESCRHAMRSESPELRMAAVAVLGTYAADSATVDQLFIGLADETRGVWQQAANALYRQYRWDLPGVRQRITERLAVTPKRAADNTLKNRYELIQRIIRGDVQPEWLELAF